MRDGCNLLVHPVLLPKGRYTIIDPVSIDKVVKVHVIMLIDKRRQAMQGDADVIGQLPERIAML